MKKKLYANNIFSLAYQILSIIVGLILPRMILKTYGSEANGLISSITQMLGFISILDLGVGAVVQAALYKPLSLKNDLQISLIYSSAKKYFQIIAKALMIYIFLLCIYYCMNESNKFSSLYTITLILSISISSFAQYYFGICNTLLLNADQKIYINVIFNLITLIINALFSILLMYLNLSIQIVKLVSSMIFLMRPFFLSIYVKKKYSIHIIKNPPANVIKQKWNGLAQHISTVLTSQIDYAVLTVFSTYKSISIYNIYILPLMGIRTLVDSVSSSYKSFFGKLIAENNLKQLEKEFTNYEIMMHLFVVIVFCCTAKVIIPFVLIYTNGVNDTNYDQPFFSLIITLSYALYTLRIPYTTIIFSAGHFKQTQIYSIIECILNVVLSILFVKYFDISGAALGTCIAVLYRLLVSSYYLKNNILKRSFIAFLKLLFKDTLSIILIILLTAKMQITEITIFNWVIFSLKIFSLCSVVTVLVFLNFNVLRLKKILIAQFNKILNNVRYRVKK
ncbi:lipopolysaccharide biosynthesis protein [Merdibacter massiliensis]|uniref:lipopolysaccharide biosynthesis protein n=1 Tax=Merdibacter massiliensis TaxID=1871030 RepID=UPI00096A4871|nr:polysaccharide biosynthesis C-terminal domain-containing protein [Merdibacter massiliensis]